MLMGEFNHSIDAKGRVIMPADFRQELGEAFFITKGLDGCLFIYAEQEWAAISEKLKSLPLAKSEARAFVRFFYSGARKLEFDKQGRFLVPGNLRTYANLKKDVVLTGVIARAELWDRETWDKYNGEVNPAVTDIAEQLADLGI